MDADRRAAPLQFEREHQAGQLRLAVGGHRRVAARRLQVVELQRAIARGDAGQRHHARVGAGAQQRQQVRGQRVVAEVVGAELQLEAVFGHLPRRWRHHRGVVDQQVEARVPCAEALAEFMDGLEAGQVQRLEGHVRGRQRLADLVDGGRALRRVAAGDDDFGPGPGQGQRGLEPQAAGAGDERAATVLGRNLGGCPRGHGVVSGASGRYSGCRYLCTKCKYYCIKYISARGASPCQSRFR